MSHENPSRRISRRAAMIGGAVATLGMPGCAGPRESYRWKLTLEAEVDGVVKRAFNVVEFWGRSNFGSSVSGGQIGEALYMDLGPQRRPLIALLTRRYDYDTPERLRKPCRWGENGPRCVAQLYGLPALTSDPETKRYVGFSTFKRQRGPRDITTDPLPDLVTFADVRDPKSAMEVDRDDPGVALACRFEWKRMTLEVTDELLTTGIEKKLPWLNKAMQGGYIDGQLTHNSRTLANTLDAGDFKRGVK